MVFGFKLVKAPGPGSHGSRRRSVGQRGHPCLSPPQNTYRGQCGGRGVAEHPRLLPLPRSSKGTAGQGTGGCRGGDRQRRGGTGGGHAGMTARTLSRPSGCGSENQTAPRRHLLAAPRVLGQERSRERVGASPSTPRALGTQAPPVPRTPHTAEAPQNTPCSWGNPCTPTMGAAQDPVGLGAFWQRLPLEASVSPKGHRNSQGSPAASGAPP